MFNLKDDIESLRLWRENIDRKSREIIKLWQSTIEDNLENLGNEKFVVLEQACVAALDTYELNVAKRCIQLLNSAFPNSIRVRTLEAMWFEVDEKYEEAMHILENIIKQDSTNSAARKRKIAILKAQGKSIEAIKELTDYLKIYMADIEAWQELSELYLNENEFNKAAFCVEELIIHNPHNHLLHQRYADIKYSQGGQENIEIAKNYYCQALKLNPNNIRALYGVYLTGTHTSITKNAQKKKDSSKLVEWSVKEIEKRYSKVSSPLSDLEERLAALEV
ncbi:unnamed protein product [Brassicogethes aeneus]|uniref:ER membrane protein complex subunit 2 n=1 Tax=Brassicogethes aeneus TaxID=1431903 RepID=A0A9P0BB27_BRAAE|nr:unnamed protein product [Brassicogethes aeneus]